ncbi:hypothetical protein RRV45_20930 [Bacillus sp. DTU_2020_1000418_1_SI_GHA_SEK_038]|uniref:hypothetical protein n=1 Tax=Bacillus sp. DTU_2020_1000418_1_SI_GHA_SEK_038 TaxID=3077585 RepID=UPI0028EB7B3D|nr:hypothetical protein [Bacillus sp. DTU_2020_1000418_1_SI_GHA_SEK_038]WNS75305.1 hypothetical protein RRV45_20930 [Bacillus sp. DTU_2020_1000418_1_SI_GHA_SEK_038]
MKRIFLFAATIGISIGFYYLYQKQLGAIPFFLISILLFSLAYSQLSQKTNDSAKNEKDKGRKI